MHTPVIIGTGQVVYRGQPVAASEFSPVGLAATAASRALSDAGLGSEGAAKIDVIAAVRQFADSYVGGEHPFGSANNYPRAVATRIGANPERAIYGEVGGQSPQRLVNELCEVIAEGRQEMALLVGAEATGLVKAARRVGCLALDWNEDTGGELDDRGIGQPLVNKSEARHRLFHPVNVYALIEHALRARLGRTREQHRQAMAKLFATFSVIAAQNPYAQFPVARTADFLATVSVENYAISDPFTKWLVAQDAVNQGAAVLIASEAQADRLEVAKGRRVYLHGYADVDDLFVSERPRIGGSQALHLAARHALEAANIGVRQLLDIDLYSCFPCAVSVACEAFGIDEGEARPLTVTGGLPYFGGPGNAYSLFAIAEMVSRLRSETSAVGVVSANGGYLSKESIGIYSATPPGRPWLRVDSRHLTAQIRRQGVEVSSRPGGGGVIETFTVDYQKGRPVAGWVLGRMRESNQRFIALVHREDGETLQGLLSGEPIGRAVQVTAGEKVNVFRFAD
jgi:acetyl-CoA C-acetyltransferase